jgi:ubiquinone/menaquinone biosynthesis C-methylase UbiE
MTNFNERSRLAYNKKADDYDNSREGQFTSNFHRLLLSEMTWRENQRVLDVACGTGSLLAAVNDQKGISGVGVDISDQMVRNAAIKNPGMDFHVSGCESLPFENDSIDIITACAAYHHFPDVEAFAREAGRVLRPNGLIYIADVYLPAFLRLIINPFVPLIFKAGDVRFYSPNGIVSSFRRFGFEKTSVKIIGNIQIISMQMGEQSKIQEETR